MATGAATERDSKRISSGTHGDLSARHYSWLQCYSKALQRYPNLSCLTPRQPTAVPSRSAARWTAAAVVPRSTGPRPPSRHGEVAGQFTTNRRHTVSGPNPSPICEQRRAQLPNIQRSILAARTPAPSAVSPSPRPANGQPCAHPRTASTRPGSNSQRAMPAVLNGQNGRTLDLRSTQAETLTSCLHPPASGRVAPDLVWDAAAPGGAHAGLGDAPGQEADARRPEPSPEQVARMRATAEVFLAHLIRPTTHYRPDIAALRAAPTRIVVARGDTSKGQWRLPISSVPPWSTSPVITAGSWPSRSSAAAYWTTCSPKRSESADRCKRFSRGERNPIKSCRSGSCHGHAPYRAWHVITFRTPQARAISVAGPPITHPQADDPHAAEHRPLTHARRDPSRGREEVDHPWNRKRT